LHALNSLLILESRIRYLPGGGGRLNRRGLSLALRNNPRLRFLKSLRSLFLPGRFFLFRFPPPVVQRVPADCQNAGSDFAIDTGKNFSKAANCAV